MKGEKEGKRKGGRERGKHEKTVPGYERKHQQLCATGQVYNCIGSHSVAQSTDMHL